MSNTDTLHMAALEKKCEEFKGCNAELEARVKLLQEFLQCVRSYFGTTCGWVDLFEEDAKKLLEGRVMT